MKTSGADPVDIIRGVKKYKLKPHKGLTKRVKVTGTGKILRHKPNKHHLMTSKSSKRRRRLGTPALVAKVDMRRLRRLLALA